jgi:hypothetical protein
MSSKSLTKHFKGFGSGFTELDAKLDADRLLILPSISDKMKHEVNKSTCVKTMHAHSMGSPGTDAIGFWKCDLGLPSHPLSQRQLHLITVWELSDATLYTFLFV